MKGSASPVSPLRKSQDTPTSRAPGNASFEPINAVSLGWKRPVLWEAVRSLRSMPTDCGDGFMTFLMTNQIPSLLG